ncbi:hypothetical protein SESBI_41604 [Sesbania bispinosa]|nr:hypothetical protein SESBI_41604 [Sesbania bispinosa]
MTARVSHGWARWARLCAHGQQSSRNDAVRVTCEAARRAMRTVHYGSSRTSNTRRPQVDDGFYRAAKRESKKKGI